jgi:hypothetical protein
MFKFVYDTQSFEHVFNLPNGALFSQDSIIDIQLMNDISPNWIYTEGKPSAVGILYENRMTVYVAEKEGDVLFKESVWLALQDAAKVSKLYAFNWRFERDVLKVLFGGFEFPFNEIIPIRGVGWNRDKCYNVLREKGVLKISKEIYDIYGGDSKKPMIDFADWLKDGDHQHLMNIVHHNLHCLIKESLIHKNRDWFAKNYALNGKGFEKK